MPPHPRRLRPPIPSPTSVPLAFAYSSNPGVLHQQAMLLISPYSASPSLSPYASLSFFLLTEGAFSLQAAVGYDRFAAPQLCSCRTGRSLFKLDVCTLSLPALSALSDRRRSVRGMDRERDGQSKRATDESKWKDGRGPGDRRQKEKWSCSE